MKSILVFCTAVLLSITIASAGPIVSKDIDTNAKWFGHLNTEAIRAMKLVQDMKTMFPDCQKRWDERMGEMSKQLGMNPDQDLLGATLYSDRYGEKDGVALFYVKNLDKQKMLDFLKKKHPDTKSNEYDNHTLYQWMGWCCGQRMELTGVFASDSVIVIGAKADDVKSALDVLDGKKPGMAADAALLKGIPDNALMACRGIDVPEEYRKTTRCPVLKNCKSASAVWSEKDGVISAKYDFDTDSSQTAQNFKALVDGFAALGRLRYSNVPAVLKVLDGLKTESAGENFTATVNVATEDVEAAIKAAMEQAKTRHHGMRHHGPMKKMEEKKVQS